MLPKIAARRLISLAALAAPALLAPSTALASTVPSAPALIIPKNITYWAMFTGATAVVKFVMVVLLLASVVTWTIWIAKSLELQKGKTQLKRDNVVLAEAADIKEVANLAHGATGRMIDAARSEIARAGPVQTVEASEGLKERVAARLLNIESGSIEKMLKGTMVLATVGAITPFVGLFGTVWGIMNSFIGISQSNTTNLAVVAPGIAEALLATAMGLVAAIPAVIMYNHVARFIAGQRRLLSEASTNIACLLSHEVDRQLSGRIRPAQAA